ncbi:MAG: hypothetical protein WCD45_04535, partial [Gallionella sp.]
MQFGNRPVRVTHPQYNFDSSAIKSETENFGRYPIVTKNETQIVRALETDIDGIVALLAENQPERGGTLSANPSYSEIAKMMREMPIIVARRSNQITGFLMT